MKSIDKVLGVAGAALVLASAPAWAHVGQAGHQHSGFLAGLAHPVGGLDHLLAMLAVGIWSALASRGDMRKASAAPAAFVAAMLLGALAGHAGLSLPLVETGIAVSVLALGLLIAARIELPALVGAGLVALFAIWHGHAHGAETTGAIAAYMAGFALTTTALHVAGIGLGVALARVRIAASLTGGIIAAAGAYLLAG
jgi:urease accessory protein